MIEIIETLLDRLYDRFNNKLITKIIGCNVCAPHNNIFMTFSSKIGRKLNVTNFYYYE